MNLKLIIEIDVFNRIAEGECKALTGEERKKFGPTEERNWFTNQPK